MSRLRPFCRSTRRNFPSETRQVVGQLRKLFKNHIVKLNRYQTSVGRDIEGLRLDRNERVAPLPQDVLTEIFSQFTPAALAAHPESDALYGKIAKYLGVKVEQLYLTNGITEGINFLFMTLCMPEHNIVVLDPTYPMYSIYAALHDVEYRPFRYGSDLKPDWQTLEAAIDERTAFVVIANPNLPVESAFDKMELRRLATMCRDRGCGLVVDEAYHHFGAESAIELLDEFDNLIVMRTFSKAFGLASIRLGYMVSHAENISYLSKTRSIVESNTLSMGVAGYMLDHVDIMESHVHDVKEGAAYLQNALDEEGLRWHGGKFTNGLLIFLDDIGSPAGLIAFMKARKIYIRGGFSRPYDQCARVSIGDRASMETFVAALKEWLAFARAQRVSVG